MPASDDYLASHPVAPPPVRNDSLRVMFVHGGGSTDVTDKEQSPFARYLRARFEHFSMKAVRHTSDFELVIRTHAEEARRFQPDILVGKSQGGPTILEMMHRGIWRGPAVLCCPAIVPEVDAHLMRLPDSLPLLIVAGASDEQVPLARVEDLYAANRARLQGGCALIVVQDRHALHSLLNDAEPAPHLEGSDGADTACGTLAQMVETCWEMRQRCAAKAGYDHAARLPAAEVPVSAAAPTDVSVSVSRWNRRARHRPLKAAFWRPAGGSEKCAVM